MRWAGPIKLSPTASRRPVWLRRLGVSPSVRFALGLTFYLAIAAVAYPLARNHMFFAVQGFAQFTASCTYQIIRLFVSEVSLEGHLLVVNGFQALVIVECTGLFEALIFVAAVLAVPASWGQRAIGIALGFPLLAKSSIELVYHYYRQARAAPFLRDAGFKRRPNGVHRTIGHEWDVILGLEEWEILEIEVIGSAFRSGAAFDPKQGRTSYKGVFQARLNF